MVALRCPLASSASVGFGQVGVAGDGVDEFGFIHVYVLFEKLKVIRVFVLSN